MSCKRSRHKQHIIKKQWQWSLYVIWPPTHHFTKSIELAYHFFHCNYKYKTTQQMYSLYTVYIILHSKMLIHNSLHFPNFFTFSLES